MDKRTKKEFKDYNDFRDRPFGLKWGTAYAMDDLMKGVRANEEYALKTNKARRQMTREEIDTVLSESFLQKKEVILQLNLLDEFGRLLDDLSGFFDGEAYEDYFVLNDHIIRWEDVRHIETKKVIKWFDVAMFSDTTLLKKEGDLKKELTLDLEKDEFYQPFFEEGDWHEFE